VNQPYPVRVKTSDPEVLSRIGAGEVGALGILFDRYANDVRHFLVRLGVRTGEVDDLVQATFLDVLHAACAFDGRPSARNWLFGVASIRVRRHRRSLVRRARDLVAWGYEEAPPPETPGQSFERREAAGRALHALGRLSERKRDVFVMVVLEGMSGEEVARILGIPVATVWTRLHHARRDLRKELAVKESS
jgi:RNA polymerase sigma-70 factor (ECF subfamily)